MISNITVLKEKPTEIIYPVVGVFDDGEDRFYVLFVDAKKGTIIKTEKGNYWKIRSYSEYWDMAKFNLVDCTIEFKA